jgi:hypothetical protein
LADDRPLPERARLLAQILVGGKKRVELMAANLCEGATLLARRLHMPDEVVLALGQLMERWDGKGFPGDVAGEEISRPLRIVRVAHDFLAVADARDQEAAIAALKRRRGRGYDPAIVDAALAEPEALLRAADVPDAWERVIDAEPRPVATISSAGLASVARAFGEFTDVKIAFLHGHSTRVSELGYVDEVMPDAAAFATIDKPALLVAASESPPEQREMTEAMAGVLPDARTALVAGGHLIDPAAPEVLAFVEEVLESR